ncbi:MAG: tetratricopeptide repeat protein [Magnetococcales bacterium]|nr:tetratricopeptide repeat protein [Magnetococcales bacterium]
MNRAEKRRQKKRAKKSRQSKHSGHSGHSGQPGLANIQIQMQQGIAFHQEGKLDAAMGCYKQVLALQPDNVAVLSNMGAVFHAQGQLDAAASYFQKSLTLKPDFPEASFNLGSVLAAKSLYEEAIEYYKKAISLKPDYVEAFNNLGIAFRKLGNFDAAVSCYQETLRLQPNYIESMTNLGVILEKQSRYSDAIENYRAALAITPDSPEILSNLGLSLSKLGQLVEAASCMQRAISLLPNQSKFWNNFGNILTEQGRLAKGVEKYRNAIELNPGYALAINNLGIALDSLNFDVLANYRRGQEVNINCDKFPDLSSRSVHHADSILNIDPVSESLLTNRLESAIARYQVKKLAGGVGNGDYEEIVAALPTLPFETVANTKKISSPALVGAATTGTKKVVAMMGLASAGSGLFHSQLDGHPEISITPGVYLSGYFGRGVWKNIISSGYEGAVVKFCQMYSVLFDSRSLQKPPPAHLTDEYGLGTGIGIDEGFDKLGENFDTPLTLDQNRFADKLSEILSMQNSINHGTFFQHVHHAYESTLGNDFQMKKIILHHIHKVDPFSMHTLLKNFPDARLLTIVRNPVQGCESWANKAAQLKQVANDYIRYSRAIQRIVMTMRDINGLQFSRQDAVGIRLEDIKGDPQNTMRRLCDWLEISESSTLLESTIQGLKWWGDPGSVLFGKTQTDDHGNEEPIRRKSGALFSEQDRFILGTLFYPLSVKFGYVEKNQDKFVSDLEMVRHLLEKPLDFELALSKKIPKDYPELEMTAAYKAFHSMLLGRWRILDEFGTYPNMFNPLPA